MVYDLCVIGGGINGCGIARDAALRGLSVLLLEAEDLANATSSSSTKLIHGGLRYLEYYEFRLVREALIERDRMLKIAPHITWPLTFVLPHDPKMRPKWMLRAGLFLYDNIAGRRAMARSGRVSLKNHPWGQMMHQQSGTAFHYTDGWVEDSRLVALNARDARLHGADVKTRSRVTSIAHDGTNWSIGWNGGEAKARMVVNAAGPWVRKLLDDTKMAGSKTPYVRLVRGSHGVFPKIYDGDQAYILQQPDGRIVFTIPYEQNFTLVGTTDVPQETAPETAKASDEEIQYLCDAVNRWMKADLTPEKMVWSYSGVRPLLDDGAENASAVTRDYRLEWHDDQPSPFLSVFGGKLTTYRALAQKAVDMICKADNNTSPCKTAEQPLPGGDMDKADILKALTEVSKNTAERWARAYGSDALKIQAQKGHEIGDGVYSGEIDWLVREEWAQTSEDILWRRSKLGLHVSDTTAAQIDVYLNQKQAA